RYGVECSSQAGSCVLLVAIRPQALFAARPARFHLDEELQIDRAAEQLLEVQAGIGRDALDALAARADHDRLLAVAIDEDRRVDAAQLRRLLEALDLDGAGVRQLVAELAKQLLADQFGSQETLAAIGQRVGLVARRSHRQPRGAQVEQQFHLPPGSRTDWFDLVDVKATPGAYDT